MNNVLNRRVLKVGFALIGVFLAALTGWLIGTLLEHMPGPGGLPVIVSLIGVMIALDVLVLGEALKSRE
ncbi:hypothetical protein MUP77_15885 [Candidatus Bathyarchaeota archaeon]|nr:hypothetical protein [Candidatus Bathyarchaeota archaeon]